MKKALITGITGQDGSYLAEYLLSIGYEVHGIIRRLSVTEHQSARIDHIDNDVTTYYGDLLDEPSLNRIIKQVQPDEIYNIAAMSHVRISFDVPAFTIKTNSQGVLNMLEATKEHAPHAKFYQASSSEMFGNQVDEDGCQRLSTPMVPVSPYGCSKVMAFNLVNLYRESYGMKCYNGVLFNHESPRRGTNFVTNKIIKSAINIFRGTQDTLELGNLDASRDWGHAADYVRAMHTIMQHDLPSNWIVSMGESRTVREFCDMVFSKLNMDYRDYVVQNEKYMRPNELKYLKGDSSEIRNKLGWTPEYTFETMVDEMINHWLTHYKE